MPGEDDDLSMRATLDDAVSAVLARIEQRLDSLEGKLVEVNVAGRAAGEGVEEGAEQGEQALREEETQADKTKESVKGLGDETERSSKKTDAATSRWQRYQKQLGKTAKQLGGFGRVMKAVKFTLFIGLAFAAAGALAALGAAAVMATGGLMQMVPGLAALAPVGIAVMLAMKAAKLGMEELQPQVDVLKGKFDGLGAAVARGGLRQGLDYMIDRIDPFVSVLESGFERIGSSLGFGAEAMTNFITTSARLDQVDRLFVGFEQILDRLIPGVFSLSGGMMNLLDASMPAGKELAAMFSRAAASFDGWAAAQLRSGNAQLVMLNSLELLKRAGSVLGDVIAGLFRIFQIAGHEAGWMGLSIEAAAAKFRAWTESLAGGLAIRQYFIDSIPAIKEMALLIGDLLKMFFGLAASGDVAPLINQLRTEFLPAIGEALAMISGQGGLLPSVLSAGTELAKMFTSLDLGAITFLVTMFANLVTGITSFIANTPGMSTLVSLFALLWVVGGAVLSIVTAMIGAWTWLTVAVAGTGQLTVAQMLLNRTLVFGRNMLTILQLWWIGLGGTMGVVTTIMGAVRTAALFMWSALLTPIGLIIIAIVAVIAIIVLLWNNCAWFRDAVLAAWTWIQQAAINTWNWIRDAAINTWNAITGAVAVAVGVISAIWNWLWTNVFKPVIDFIIGYWTVVWNIVSFVVQTAVFIIVGIITLLALLLQAIWWVIATVATWVWQNVILPVIQFVAGIVIAIWTAIVAFFTWVWGIIVQQATFAWGIITAAAQAVGGFLMAIWNGIVAFFTWVWGIIVQQAQAAWSNIMAAVSAVVNWLRPVWEPIAAFFSGLFSNIATAGRSAFDGIRAAAGVVASVVRGAWDAVAGAVKGAYNAIARGWNSIPSITVPAWVPLIGGSTFSLPKLPTLWHGGKIAFDSAIVGEHGPEPLIGPSGQYMGMLGANGPEIASGLPRGGYVVPNLDTLTRMPGLLKTLPSGVGAAVARSVPGYAGALAPAARTTVVAPPAAAGRDRGDAAMAGALHAVARAVAERPPPIAASGPDVEEQVFAALRRWEQRKAIRSKYTYGGTS